MEALLEGLAAVAIGGEAEGGVLAAEAGFEREALSVAACRVRVERGFGAIGEVVEMLGAALEGGEGSAEDGVGVEGGETLTEAEEVVTVGSGEAGTGGAGRRSAMPYWESVRSSAAAEGVGAWRSAAESAMVVSVAWPMPVMTGTEQAAMARATISASKPWRSSKEPPPRATRTTSAWLGCAENQHRRRSRRGQLGPCTAAG